eukprot:8608749-Heterocapsa_arctica.AAC.1
MPGRVWLFNLVLSMIATEEYRAAVCCLELHKSTKNTLRVEPRREIQSQRENIMWEYVKSNPRQPHPTETE